MYGIYFKS